MEKYKNIIRFDWAAKRLLRDKANYVVLEGLVSVLLEEKVRIVELLESEANAEREDSKFNRVDIMAKNEKGELIIIEIQLSRQVHYLERILFGVGKAISDHIFKGERYDKVKKVYSISILYFNFGTGGDYIYRGQTIFTGIHTGDKFTLSERERYNLGMRSPEEVFPVYYLIRVNEFNMIAKTPLEEWIEYLKTGRINPNTTTPGLREAAERLNFLMMEEKERRAYEHYLDNVRNEIECLESARIEGHAEGLAEGIAKGRAEGRAEGIEEGGQLKTIAIAKKMLDNGMNVKTISEMTGLSINEINSLCP